MSESERWIVKCQDANDGSGDVIVDLPPELLSKMGISVGDELSISVVNGGIELKRLPPLDAILARTMPAGATRDAVSQAYRILLEASLQIPVNASDQSIHDMIEAGFPATMVEWLCDNGTISAIDRNNIIPLETLEAKSTGNQRLSVDESDRLYRVVHVNCLAEVIFGDAVKAKHWLSTAKSRFSGNSPNAMLSTTPGTRLVEELLIQVAEGMAF